MRVRAGFRDLAGRDRDLADHDHEFDEVRWIGFDEAATLLTFETERALAARAVAAATIFGDGRVALILDVEKLTELSAEGRTPVGPAMTATTRNNLL